MTGMAPDRQLSAERWTRGPGRGEAANTLQTTYSNTVHTFTIQPGPAFSKCCPNARFPLSTRLGVCMRCQSVLMRLSRS